MIDEKTVLLKLNLGLTLSKVASHHPDICWTPSQSQPTAIKARTAELSVGEVRPLEAGTNETVPIYWLGVQLGKLNYTAQSANICKRRRFGRSSRYLRLTSLASWRYNSSRSYLFQ